MKNAAEPKTLVDAIRYFSDPDTCLAFLVGLRWPNGVTCPTCGSTEVSFLSTRRLWSCKVKHAKRQFSVKVGTVMEDSPIGLDKWLCALWMVVNCKNGVSSYEMARNLGITQKSAWFLNHRIRRALNSEGGIFGGEVEADETFIGGKARFMHADKKAAAKGRSGRGKVAVLGLLDRHGRDGHSVVKAHVVSNVRGSSLIPRINDVVMPGSTVYTDELKSYDFLDEAYAHEVINHAECYAKGRIHTNGIENFWSLLKRSIKGTYVSVEPFHLFRYLDEQSFRFNTRKGSDLARFVMAAGRFAGKRLTYKQLTGENLSGLET